MPISPLINDIVLAYMNKRDLKIYTPFLEGGSLTTLVKRRGKLTEHTALKILAAVIKALD